VRSDIVTCGGRRQRGRDQCRDRTLDCLLQRVGELLHQIIDYHMFGILLVDDAGENLVHRAADVVLKERRRLVIVPRETPLSEIHLENLLKLARMGVAIVPPMPAFYNKPGTLDDMIDHIVARVLDQFDIDAGFARRWDGVMHASKPTLRRA